MALLSLEKRKQYFKDLGLEYNEATIKALQKKYMLRKSDADGKYGPNTDNMLRTVHNVLTHTKNFDPREFRCECGGKYCCGFPSYMKKVELKNLQAIRDHYGKPMDITCGLRCKPYNNKLRGSIKNSLHLTGYAADFHIDDVTETLAQRKKAIKYIKKLPNHHYTYGDGINSAGAKISARYMGDSLHTDTNKPKKKTTAKTTVKTEPKVNQAVQNTADTMAKAATTAAPVKVTPYLTQAQLDVWFAALKKQYENAKNSVYAWVEGPTYANSKKKCTCIAEHSVALQLIGLLPKKGYFYYHPKKKRLSGNRAKYVKKHTELFKVLYPHKKLTTLIKQGKLYPGDIVGFGNPGYHSMVYMGKNSNGKPKFATLGHKKGYGVTYPSYAKRKVDMIVRLKKVSK